MRVTIEAVNAALRAEGIEAELIRGRGYFYFSGAAFERAPSTSVMVANLSQLSVEQWIGEARGLIAAIPTRVSDSGRPYFDQCTRRRRWLVRHGTLNLATGETEFDVKPPTWEEGPCSTPLFGDDRTRSGICRGCERGWFVATNYPIGPDPRVKTAPVVILTEQGARFRATNIAPRTELAVDHFSQVLPDGDLVAHIVHNGARWSLGVGDYAIRPDVAGECKVMEDPGEAGVWVIIWDGQLCSPTFNSQGAAEVCLGMYRDGVRKPELRREAARA